MYDRHINVITPNLQKGSPSGSRGKESACSAGDTGDMGSIPGLGRSLGEENSNILQYSYVRKPMDRGAWWCRVRGLEKARFRKRMRLALTLPLSHTFNEARRGSSQIRSCCTNPRKEEVYTGMYVESYCPKGAYSPRLFRVVIS